MEPLGAGDAVIFVGALFWEIQIYLGVHLGAIGEVAPVKALLGPNPIGICDAWARPIATSCAGLFMRHLSMP